MVGCSSGRLAVLVESFVGQRCLPAGERCQEGLDLEERFQVMMLSGRSAWQRTSMSRAVVSGISGVRGEQLGEVVAQGAAGADALSVELTFVVAARAVEVVGDSGAGCASWAAAGLG